MLTFLVHMSLGVLQNRMKINDQYLWQSNASKDHAEIIPLFPYMAEFRQTLKNLLTFKAFQR